MASKYSIGIPFKITCSHLAASQFYKPLQEGVSSDKRAAFYGGIAVNAARNFLIDIKSKLFLYKYYQFIHN